MKWNLVVDNGGHKGEMIPIRMSPFLIGRNDDCQLRPTNGSVSRHHCALIRHGNALVLRDCQSTNGTFLNAHQVKGEVELHSGDRLGIGSLAFVVSRQGQAGPQRPHQSGSPRVVSEEAVAALLLETDKEETQRGEQEGVQNSLGAGDEEFRLPQNCPPGDPEVAPEKPTLSQAELAAAILRKKSYRWLRPKTSSGPEATAQN
jgi:pSer/pThr/pTyr-binding forkhead associated (FHA) protein